MAITPNASVFTAISVTDFAKPVRRADVAAVKSSDPQTPRQAPATAQTSATAQTPDAKASAPGHAAPRTAAGPEEAPAFRRMGQLYDISA